MRDLEDQIKKYAYDSTNWIQDKPNNAQKLWMWLIKHGDHKGLLVVAGIFVFFIFLALYLGFLGLQYLVPLLRTCVPT